jgi:repressor LexA
MHLTKRQKDIFQFIQDYLRINNYSPSLEEIGANFGISSMNGVHKHLKTLEERGYIRRISNKARSIQLVSEELDKHTLPLLGYIAAGQPIEAVESPEEVEVPEYLMKRGDHYVLEVEGESMIDHHIQNGDRVVIQKQEHANNGETVVALIDGENATLKQYYREGRRIRLQPANSNMDPIYVEESRLRIQGVLVGLIRKY